MKFRTLAMVLLILVLLSLTPNFSHSQENHLPNWTFMVYMDADNSLHSFALDNLGAMMSVGSNANLNIVVMYDSIKYGDSAIYYIQRGQIKVMEKLGEVDMGSPQTLRYFLNWTMDHYPAKHYFLDLWDHGHFYGGVCEDHGDWLTLGEMRDAIGYVERERGRMVDVIGFDACRMGIMENFYALRNLTHYVVASEKDEPASGWPYGMILENMSNETPSQAARNVVDAMYRWSEEYFSKKGLSTTMVAVNMTRFESFIGVFNDDLKSMLSVTPYYYAEILNASRNAERYELYSDMDLYSFAKNLGMIPDYKIDKFAEDTMRWLDNISYYRVWNCPHPVNGIWANESHGIGIYFPTFGVAESYRSLDFARHTYWPRFLDLLFNPYVVGRENGTVEYSLNGSKLQISYEANTSLVEIYVVSGGGVYNHTILPPTGNFTLNLTYGAYHVYLYGYEGGYVVWVRTFSVNCTKIVKIKVVFYINGYVANGAKIVLEISNRTYSAVQNGTGVMFFLHYPTEINSQSQMIFKVTYGSFHDTYFIRPESLRGNDTFYVSINSFSPFFFPYTVLWAGIVIGSVITVILWKKRARRDSNPRPRD